MKKKKEKNRDTDKKKNRGKNRNCFFFVLFVLESHQTQKGKVSKESAVLLVSHVPLVPHVLLI